MIPDKDTIRRDVWEKLLQVAIPNAFFRLNFAEVIPDFVGSENAVQAIRNHPRWRASQLMFLTPDDISALRVAAYEDGKRYVHKTEGLDDMPAHIRAALSQTQLAIPVASGRMVLGTWQGIYLFEHRRAPHRREIVLHLLGE